MAIPPLAYQAIVAAPGFAVGVRCDAQHVLGLDFLPPSVDCAPVNALAVEATRQLRGYLSDPAFVFALPLRPAGTPFQRLVWAEIARIPCYRTRTYGELARLIGSAPRAVGQACGANPYPVIVPCHRVVSATGGLGGFARQTAGFLLDVKRWLLAHERDG